MRILRATHLGFCFGVRDAIDLALDHPRPITILGDLVHNETVLAALRARGIRFARQPDEVETPEVMITAHGASDQSIAGLRQRGLEVVEATCPLVRLAHRAVLELAGAGFHPVIIGQRDHVEVRGLTGDLAEYDVVLNEMEADRLPERPRFGIIAQTTQPLDRVRRLVELIRGRYPRSEVRFIDTVCRPTKQRQEAAVEISVVSDVVVVIGGATSNNTRQLAATCGMYCPRVFMVQTAADLRPEWFAEAGTVGVTAGTSTPDAVIAAVERRLSEFAAAAARDAGPHAREERRHAPALAARAA